MHILSKTIIAGEPSFSLNIFCVKYIIDINPENARRNFQAPFVKTPLIVQMENQYFQKIQIGSSAKCLSRTEANFVEEI